MMRYDILAGLRLLGMVCLLAARVWAMELSTTNREYLAMFRAAVDAQQSMVTIVSFGDSMADSHRSINYVLMNRFRARLGVAGYSLLPYGNTTLWSLTNGATAVGPSSLWFTDHVRLPPGGGVWWYNQNHAHGVLSDRVGVFWVAHPSGGELDLAVSTNGGPWTSLLTLPGYAPLPGGCFTNLLLPLNYHRIRVASLSGTNFILGPQVVNTQTNGGHFVFMDRWGIGLSQVTKVPRAIREPVFAALSPDLLIWHMKEDGSEVTRQWMLECEEWWTDAAPNCGVLYIGTPWVSIDTNTTYRGCYESFCKPLLQ